MTILLASLYFVDWLYALMEKKMKEIIKKQVLEILDYWKLIEFLSQKNIPKQDSKHKKIMEQIKNGEKTNKDVKKIEIFIELNFSDFNYINFNVTKQLNDDNDNYSDYSSIGEDFSYCIGKIKRNTVVEYLAQYIENKNESPEVSYNENEAIAWCSFKTDLNGVYIKGSFQLSPILWAISIWGKPNTQKNQDFNLDKDKYDDIVVNLDKNLQGKNVTSFLSDLYKKIYNDYAKAISPNSLNDVTILIEYNRFLSEEIKNKSENLINYSDLGKSFFLNDIIQLENLIRSDNFGDRNAYEKKVIEYILSGYEKSIEKKNIKRRIISPEEPPEEMKSFFEETLKVTKAPMGKWPARFMPALMQQVAVNLAIKQNDDAPIFSVNGPPGTGKTTLLKEIVASNIVDRAKILADCNGAPDDFFTKHKFSQGPLNDNSYCKYAPAYYSIKNDLINNYSMLVASCNNAAVENITVDLPNGKDILESLKVCSDDDDSVRNGLQEVRDLFDINKTQDIETIKVYGKNKEEKDIYFTRYANELLKKDDCWGLVSAPLGKRSNIKKYCQDVLNPFVKEYSLNDFYESHKKEYIETKELFLNQYQLVENLKKELETMCTLANSIPLEIQKMSSDTITEYANDIENQIKDCLLKQNEAQASLMKLEKHNWIKRIFSTHKTKSTNNLLIKENKNTISEMKIKMQQLEEKKESICHLKEYRRKINEYLKGKKKMTPIDSIFIEQYCSADSKASTKSQVINPWFTAEYNREREKLFLYACRLHKKFVISSKCMRQNIINLMIAWNMYDDCKERMKPKDREAAMPYMLQSLFLFTPVISTTFASAQTFLGDISKSGVLGTLIVDEAGQAQPQMALGAMFRCRKAIIVGDPKQIEPVVTDESDIIKQLLSSKLLTNYKDKKISVQGFADYINPYGTFLGEDDEKEWVGCPLVVHRRCIDPMYTISNVLSYSGTMKQQTGAPKEELVKRFILDKSCWVNIIGSENSGAKDHFVNAQGEIVLKLLTTKFRKDSSDIPKLFIITPFTSVKTGMIDMIRNSNLYRHEPRVKEWLNDNNVGTVHTFQGKGADEVIFLLGCDDKSAGAVNWVNKNIVNVAVTRAKFRLYIIGDKNVWNRGPVNVAHKYMHDIISENNLDALLKNELNDQKPNLPN